jgi:hypothetical protein
MEIKYQKTDSGWGLTGLYEGYKLVFSGNNGTGRLQKFFSLAHFKKRLKENSIITETDLYRLFSDSAKQAWTDAYNCAQKRKNELGLEDIFLALLKRPSVKNLMCRLKVSTDDAEIFLKNYLKLQAASGMEPVRKIPFEAFLLAAELRNHKIGSLMLLGALLRCTPQDNVLQAIFSNIGLNEEKLKILASWILSLDYEFPKNSTADKLLYCCQQAQGLEQHFGYFFEFPAIEAAVSLSSKQTLKDLEHKQALQLLVQASRLAKANGTKTISEKFVREAALQKSLPL